MKGKYYAFFIVWILLTIGFTVAFCAAFMSIWSGGRNPALEDVLPGALALGLIVAFCIPPRIAFYLPVLAILFCRPLIIIRVWLALFI